MVLFKNSIKCKSSLIQINDYEMPLSGEYRNIPKYDKYNEETCTTSTSSWGKVRINSKGTSIR